MNNEFDFFKNYQSFLLKNSDNDNLADKQRKSIAQMYNASCLRYIINVAFSYSNVRLLVCLMKIPVFY